MDDERCSDCVLWYCDSDGHHCAVNIRAVSHVRRFRIRTAFPSACVHYVYSLVQHLWINGRYVCIRFLLRVNCRLTMALCASRSDQLFALFVGIILLAFCFITPLETSAVPLEPMHWNSDNEWNQTSWGLINWRILMATRSQKFIAEQTTPNYK